MYIKAITKKLTKQQLFSEPAKIGKPQRRQTCFQLPHYQDKMFFDDLCFNKNKIIPHIQNHRPVIKNRVLKVNEERKGSLVQKKPKLAVDSQRKYGKTLTFIDSFQQKKSFRKNSTNNKNKYFTVKETLFRAGSEIPDYARNIMKPCKIEAITMTHRPTSARKSATSQYQRQSHSGRASTGERKKKSDLKGFTIEPWEHLDDDYLIH